MKVTLLTIFTFLCEVSAWAEAPAGGTGGQAPAQPWQTFLPFIAIFAIMYFMVFRPQQKKAKAHQVFLSELKRGDMVVSSSGIVGTIKNLSDKFVTLEVDDGVCIKMVRAQIHEGASNLKDDKEDKK
jgi:preprotein translocase subunit YajC